MIVGIAGMSRSGKTTLAKSLSNHLEGTTHILHLDDFVFPEHEIPKIKHKQEIRTDWEDPSGIDFDSLYSKAIELESQFDWLILEGFLLFYDARIRALCTKKIIVQLTYPTFYKRRKPTYTPMEPDWYIHHVWDTYKDFHGGFEAQLDALVLPEAESQKFNLCLDYLQIA